MLPSSTLEDPAYRVPEAPPAASGVAALRAQVPRFCEGPDHRRRRAAVEAVIARVGAPGPAASPTTALLAALGLPAALESEVAAVAGAYQPHAPQSESADAAADRLLAATDAATVCVLVQAHAGMGALLAHAGDGPPIPATRRIAPGGEEVAVSLDGAPFGAGAHRCPGEALARTLAAAQGEAS